MLSSSLDQEVPFSLLPGFGLGWFGAPGLLGSRGQRDWTTAFHLTGVNKSENSVTLRCQDAVAGLELGLEFSLDADTDVLIRRTVLRNAGSGNYRIYRLALAGPKPPQVRFLTPGAQALVEGTLTAPGAVLMGFSLRRRISF